MYPFLSKTKIIIFHIIFKWFHISFYFAYLTPFSSPPGVAPCLSAALKPMKIRLPKISTATTCCVNFAALASLVQLKFDASSSRFNKNSKLLPTGEIISIFSIILNVFILWISINQVLNLNKIQCIQFFFNRI